jgi:hypothetical protein
MFAKLCVIQTGPSRVLENVKLSCERYARWWLGPLRETIDVYTRDWPEYCRKQEVRSNLARGRMSQWSVAGMMRGHDPSLMGRPGFR